jgi:hypothetical protein
MIPDTIPKLIVTLNVAWWLFGTVSANHMFAAVHVIPCRKPNKNLAATITQKFMYTKVGAKTTMLNKQQMRAINLRPNLMKKPERRDPTISPPIPDDDM